MELAARKSSVPVALGEVARRQNISEKYLWHVVTPLKKARLLNAVSGPRGGYSLARPAARITLRDILVAVEDGDSLVECLANVGICSRSATCAAREVWRDLDRKIGAITQSVTLEDMEKKQQDLKSVEALEYVI